MYVTICFYPDGSSVLFNRALTAKLADADHKDAVKHFIHEFVSANSKNGFVDGYNVMFQKNLFGYRGSFHWRDFDGDMRCATSFFEHGNSSPSALVLTAFVPNVSCDE